MWKCYFRYLKTESSPNLIVKKAIEQRRTQTTQPTCHSNTKVKVSRWSPYNVSSL